MELLTNARQVRDGILEPQHFSEQGLKRLAGNFNEFSSLKTRIANVNRGPVIARRFSTDEYHTYMRCGQRAWQRISMRRNSSIRDHRLRDFIAQKWYHFTAVASKHTTWSGTPARYGVDAWAPTVMPMLTSADVATITIKGSGQLILFSMGRIGIPDIAITIAGANSLYRVSDLDLSLDVSTATDFEPVYSVIAENLPDDEYTITITSSGSPITTCFPIALGIEYNEKGVAAVPHAPINDRISVMPYKTFMTDTGGTVWHDITGTNAAASINQGTPYGLNASADYIYVGVNPKVSRATEYEEDNDVFDKVELTFTVANAGAGGATIAEYWNGAWTALNVVEDTMWNASLPLSQDGHIIFEIPSDWAYCDPNSLGNGHYIRLGSTSNTSGIHLATAEVRMVWNSTWPYAIGTMVDTEAEAVLNRQQNGANTDIGGGHGNIDRTSLAVFVDGRDRTADLIVGADAIAGDILEFGQGVDMYSDEPPSGTVIGDYEHVHRFCAGMVCLNGRLTLTANTRIYPWGYLQLFGVETSYDKMILMGPSGEELEVLVSSMTYGVPAPNAPAQEFAGARFRHTDHQFAIGTVQMQSQITNDFYQHSESKSFGLLTTNVKFYQMWSGGANSKDTQEETTVRYENIYWMAPML